MLCVRGIPIPYSVHSVYIPNTRNIPTCVACDPAPTLCPTLYVRLCNLAADTHTRFRPPIGIMSAPRKFGGSILELISYSRLRPRHFIFVPRF